VNRLAGRVAAVTGSSRGIGRAIAAAFLAEGARVIVNSRQAEAAAATARELGSDTRGVAADVSMPEGAQAVVQAALETFGRLDVMVPNAGINIVKPAVDYAPEEWRGILATNLDGVFYCAQAAGRAMLEQRSGSIISIASVLSYSAFPQRAAYAAAKGGLLMLTKVLAVEWAAAGVRVNAIAPGYVATDMVKGLAGEGKVDLPAVRRRTPMGRLATPEEIAKAAVFLASDEASFITGETLVVDGGWLAYGWV